MPRRILNTVTTPEYDTQGRHVRNRIDTYFIDPPEPPPWRTTPVPARGPQIEYYPCPDVGRLVTMVQQGQPLPPLSPPVRPRVNHLACKHCRQVSCRCGVPTLGDMGEKIVALQRQQGKRL